MGRRLGIPPPPGPPALDLSTRVDDAGSVPSRLARAASHHGEVRLSRRRSSFVPGRRRATAGQWVVVSAAPSSSMVQLRAFIFIPIQLQTSLTWMGVGCVPALPARHRCLVTTPQKDAPRNAEPAAFSMVRDKPGEECVCISTCPHRVSRSRRLSVASSRSGNRRPWCPASSPRPPWACSPPPGLVPRRRGRKCPSTSWLGGPPAPP